MAGSIYLNLPEGIYGNIAFDTAPITVCSMMLSILEDTCFSRFGTKMLLFDDVLIGLGTIQGGSADCVVV